MTAERSEHWVGGGRDMAYEVKSELPAAEIIDRTIGALEGTDVEVLELRWGSTRMRLVQNPALAAREIPVHDADLAGVLEISAPLTGVFYARPSPELDVYVAAGKTVEAGQVVGMIETMKLFNEVVSDVAGRIRDVLISDGDLVEKGQPLILVEPSEETE